MKKLYWLLPIFLALAQLAFTLYSQTQIRYEELAESARNVFWLHNGLVYDGTSSNVGWYGTLLVAYNIFGFDIFTAKYARLVLQVISLFCIAGLLSRFLSQKKAIIPLLVIGLSPTFLFFNTLQTSYGTDLQYFPICLFLLLYTSKKKVLQYVSVFFGWAIAMIAWMSYPTFVFYLPVLFLVFYNSYNGYKRYNRYIFGLVAFLLPLILAFLFIQNRGLLFFDPVLDSGIFRGAGSVQFDSDSFSKNIAGLMHDLFVKGKSYHFELEKAEFSDLYPIATVLLVFWAGLYNRYKNYNRYSFLYLIIITLFISLTMDPSGHPGMRRYTPFLASFYALFVMVWYNNKKLFAFGIMSLLLLHHIIVFPINLMHLHNPSPSAYPIWFTKENLPQVSLEKLVDIAQKENLKLVCLDENKQPVYCRLSEVYAVVAGNCMWNHLSCKKIYGFDFGKNQFIPLTRSLWDTYYFEH